MKYRADDRVIKSDFLSILKTIIAHSAVFEEKKQILSKKIIYILLNIEKKCTFAPKFTNLEYI